MLEKRKEKFCKMNMNAAWRLSRKVTFTVCLLMRKSSIRIKFLDAANYLLKKKILLRTGRLNFCV